MSTLTSCECRTKAAKRAIRTPKLTLIVLAYNEEGSVAPFLDDCLEYLDTLEGSHEIILINDGSTDSTVIRANEVAARDSRVRVISHCRNLGMGGGMRTGIQNAWGEVFTILSADGQIKAWELRKMLPYLDDCDIVLSIYTRRAHELYRKGLSMGLRGLIRLILGLSFKLEGAYLFPVSLARDEIGLDRIGSNTFFFSFELIARALQRGARTRTVQIDPAPRMAGETKIANVRQILKVWDELLHFRIRLWKEGFRLGASPKK